MDTTHIKFSPCLIMYWRIKYAASGEPFMTKTSWYTTKKKDIFFNTYDIWSFLKSMIAESHTQRCSLVLFITFSWSTSLTHDLGEILL